MVWLPMWMYCSLKIVTGGHMMMLRSPNEPNLRPLESSGPMAAQPSSAWVILAQRRPARRRMAPR